MPGHEQQLLGTDLFDEKFNYLYEDGLNLEDDDEEESELDSDTTEIEEQPAAKAVSESQQNKPVLSSTLRSTSRKTKGRKRKINKLHRCPHCDRTYPFPCELRRHLPVHTGVLLHQCATCSKSFKTQTELKQHQLFHMKIEPTSAPPALNPSEGLTF
ncbi:PREDICTED: zinc finger protein 526-like [Rhagoletis zephyria]|uniref:zinc finger protein 526-like n=1 Tax=Rhagoletis zephyria TaxID=28612 RepID=UPI000811380F|nr:PREDICTED: zinc finger protein 526-like [Rhagoletis zephyria]